MSKLVDRYTQFMWLKEAPIIAADECEEIAIKFHRWVDSKFYRFPFTTEYVKITNDPNEWPVSFGRVSIKELFDKFIDEYYE